MTDASNRIVIMNPQAVAVFARFPSPGKVKTRLAATIGDAAACRFYQHCTEAVLRQLVQCHDTCVHLFVAEVDEVKKVEEWMENMRLSIRIMGQLQSENLGDRIFHALKHLKLSGYAKVAAVATDIPDITHTVVRQGLDLLDAYDIVLGPAVDGGFYFLGVNDLSKELFEDVEWSTSTVFAKIVQNAAKLQLKMAPSPSLPPIADIDTFQDLCLWTGSSPQESCAESVVQTALEKFCQRDST